MKKVKYIADLQLEDLPTEMFNQDYVVQKWTSIDVSSRRQEMEYCIHRCLMRLEDEENVQIRKNLRSQISILRDYLKLPDSCKIVYMLTNNDVLQLPLLVADSLEELSRLTGFNDSTLCLAISRNSVLSGRYLVKRIDIREPEEKFNFEDFYQFCSKNSIASTNFKSLQRFREDCFGVWYGKNDC